MREGRDGTRLALKKIAELRAEKLYRHRAAQANVASPINRTHTAGAEGTLDFVRSEPRPRRGLHKRILQPAEVQPCRTVQDHVRGRDVVVKEGLDFPSQI